MGNELLVHLTVHNKCFSLIILRLHWQQNTHKKTKDTSYKLPYMANNGLWGLFAIPTVIGFFIAAYFVNKRRKNGKSCLCLGPIEDGQKCSKTCKQNEAYETKD